MIADPRASIGLSALADRIRDEAQDITRLTGELREHRRRRNLLIGKARHAGVSVRQIEQWAGVSNVRVSQIGGGK